MTNVVMKILVILLIFCGESLAILAEILAARAYINQPFIQAFLKVVLMMIVGGGFLVIGYILGFRLFQNIWIISVVSITSILIMEPLLIYLVFNQAPTRGGLIGFILGALGFMAALFL
ncbi:MAG: hypothetical protein KGZ97_03590 [Bacteroidetes bacterium]|nr:hypothetical protein [Bacteroidota bacterium]